MNIKEYALASVGGMRHVFPYMVRTSAYMRFNKSDVARFEEAINIENVAMPFGYAPDRSTRIYVAISRVEGFVTGNASGGIIRGRLQYKDSAQNYLSLGTINLVSIGTTPSQFVLDTLYTISDAYFETDRTPNLGNLTFEPLNGGGSTLGTNAAITWDVSFNIGLFSDYQLKDPIELKVQCDHADHNSEAADILSQ